MRRGKLPPPGLQSFGSTSPPGGEERSASAEVFAGGVEVSQYVEPCGVRHCEAAQRSVEPLRVDLRCRGHEITQDVRFAAVKFVAFGCGCEEPHRGLLVEEAHAGFGFDRAIKRDRRGVQFVPPPAFRQPFAGHRCDQPRRESRSPALLVVQNEYASPTAQERPGQRGAGQSLTDDYELRRRLHEPVTAVRTWWFASLSPCVTARQESCSFEIGPARRGCGHASRERVRRRRVRRAFRPLSTGTRSVSPPLPRTASAGTRGRRESRFLARE